MCILLIAVREMFSFWQKRVIIIGNIREIEFTVEDISRMKAIGIDIGTTTISGVVVEVGERRHSTVIEAKTIQNGSFIETSNEWEKIQDAEKIIPKAQAVLDEFIEKYPDVSSIGLTGQMHGIVYLNAEGRSVSPLYTWQDGRGNICNDKTGKSLLKEIEEQCHYKTASGYGFVTHLYNEKHHMISAEATTFCTIMDYFGVYLTKRKQPLIHVSNAAGFGFFDVQKKCFEMEWLNKMGMGTVKIPEICEDMEVLGMYKGIPVTVAIGDNQASFLGAAGSEDNTLLVNMGTGGQISVLTDQYFETEGIEARPFLERKYLLVGASLCGGKAYALLENFFRSFMKEATGKDTPLYETLGRLAEKGMNTSGSGMKVRTTFDGTRTDSGLRGEIRNISAENFTPESLTYGVLEGMIRELYDMFVQIERGTEIKIAQMIGSGNGLRKNKVLCEIAEEMFGMKLSLSECKEEAATGAAISSCL